MNGCKYRRKIMFGECSNSNGLSSVCMVGTSSFWNLLGIDKLKHKFDFQFIHGLFNAGFAVDV